MPRQDAAAIAFIALGTRAGWRTVCMSWLPTRKVAHTPIGAFVETLFGRVVVQVSAWRRFTCAKQLPTLRPRTIAVKRSRPARSAVAVM